MVKNVLKLQRDGRLPNLTLLGQQRKVVSQDLATDEPVSCGKLYSKE